MKNKLGVTTDQFTRAAQIVGRWMSDVTINGKAYEATGFEFTNHTVSAEIECYHLHIQRLSKWVNDYNGSHIDRITKIQTTKKAGAKVEVIAHLESGIVHHISKKSYTRTWQSILKLLEKLK